MQKLSRSELTKKYNLTRGQWQNRHDDLLDWMNDFFSIEEIKEGRYFYYIIPDDAPDSIPPLPRKSNKQEKIVDYENYVLENLPQNFTPLSKSKMSRDAIEDFGYDKYSHTSYKAVSRRYIGPAMDKHGEHTEKMVWVNVNTYLPLSKDEEDYLHECFHNVHLSEREMANAFKKLAQEQNIDEELDNFNKAIAIFKERYAFRPISVYEWKVKNAAVRDSL